MNWNRFPHLLETCTRTRAQTCAQTLAQTSTQTHASTRAQTRARGQFRTAMVGTGIDASTAEIDALFAKWDSDHSGAA